MRQRRHVMELYKNGRYFQCIAEAGRGMIYYGADRDEGRYIVFSSYFMGGQYLTVRNRLGAESDNTGRSDTRSRLLLSQACLRLGAFSESAAWAWKLSYEGDLAMERYEILMRRVEPLIYMERYDDISTEIEAYRKTGDPDGALAALQRDLSRHDRIPHRSKALSVVLSALVPGLGQAYCGSWLDGLLGLLGTAITAAGGAWFYRQDEKGLAGASFFFSGFFTRATSMVPGTAQRTSTAGTARCTGTDSVPGTFGPMIRLHISGGNSRAVEL